MRQICQDREREREREAILNDYDIGTDRPICMALAP